jgi:hypothetical protein
MNEDPASKLGPGARNALGCGKGEVLNVMIGIHGRLTDAHRALIEGLGIRLRTVAGDVLSADVPSGALLGLAELDFIRHVELSRPLWPDRPAGPQQQGE